MIKVLFVCLGNICRSPTAHGVMQQRLNDLGLNKQMKIDSAGTAAYHIGKAPDLRSIKAAKLRQINISHLSARQVCDEDYEIYDYILAMDKQNLANLSANQPHGSKAHLALFLTFGTMGYQEVPDPYYGDGDGFELVLDLVADACNSFLQHHNLI